jgi:hypothetical protein
MMFLSASLNEAIDFPHQHLKPLAVLVRQR